MSHKYTINVTQEHIDKGMKGNCRKCPIALAVEQDYKPLAPPQVGLTCMLITDLEGKAVTVSLPDECSNFIFRFDSERDVKPFSFELEIP